MQISWNSRLTTRVIDRRLCGECAILENKKGEIIAEEYLLPIVELVNSVQQIGTGAQLIVNNYILRLIWGNNSMYILIQIATMRMTIIQFQ